jgi:hypothetical protein
MTQPRPSQPVTSGPGVRQSTEHLRRRPNLPSPNCPGRRTWPARQRGGGRQRGSGGSSPAGAQPQPAGDMRQHCRCCAGTWWTSDRTTSGSPFSDGKRQQAAGQQQANQRQPRRARWRIKRRQPANRSQLSTTSWTRCAARSTGYWLTTRWPDSASHQRQSPGSSHTTPTNRQLSSSRHSTAADWQRPTPPSKPAQQATHTIPTRLASSRPPNVDQATAQATPRHPTQLTQHPPKPNQAAVQQRASHDSRASTQRRAKRSGQRLLSGGRRRG